MKTLEEIARSLMFTRERIRPIEAKALRQAAPAPTASGVLKEYIK